MTAHPNADLETVAPLADRVRRRLYEHVAGQGAPVDRDAAAAAVGIGRPLAAFHLDRLAEAGLLEVEYRRRTGRTGPGAGRPAKFYRRARDRQVTVSLPPRQYDLAAEILAEGVEGNRDATEDVLAAARRRGEQLAETAAAPFDAAAQGDADGRPQPGRLVAALADAGFEPFADDDGILRLRNCPFDALVERHRGLTCSMNLAMLDGLAAGLGNTGMRADGQPREGLCCVAFVPVEAAEADADSLG